MNSYYKLLMLDIKNIQKEIDELKIIINKITDKNIVCPWCNLLQSKYNIQCIKCKRSLLLIRDDIQK